MRNFKLLSVLLLCMAVVFTSCGTWNNTAKGTAIGVGGGAAGNCRESVAQHVLHGFDNRCCRGRHCRCPNR